MSVWEDRVDAIQAMVDDDWTDEQIGAVYDRSGTTIWKVRKRLGIGSKRGKSRKRRSYEEVFSGFDQSPPLAGETYTDERGLTVTRYPARYADGALIQSVTARPRRG